MVITYRILTFLFVLISIWVSAQTGSGHVVLVELEKPVYSPLARVANIYGEATVQVTIRPDGKLVSASLVSGHPMLKQSAVESAERSRYRCEDCGDKEQSILIIYRFVTIDTGDCCGQVVVPAKVEWRREQNEGEFAAKILVTSTIPHSCICDPAGSVGRKRSLKCLYLWKCS